MTSNEELRDPQRTGLSSTQIGVLAGAIFFFVLQFLPHHVTSLHGFFSFIYPVVAFLLFVSLALTTIIVLALGAYSGEPAHRRQWKAWGVTGIYATLGAALLTIGNISYQRGLPVGSYSMSFDEEQWKLPSSSEYRSGNITIRQKMLGDVIKKVVQNGTRDEILDKLGPPEDEGYFESSGRDLIYLTGDERDSFVSIDREWLLIWFDRTGRVSRYEVWTD